MINITLITNNGRHTEPISEDNTIREILDANHVNYAASVVQLDGCALRPGDMDKTFADFGITDNCYLTAVVKADNAAKVTVIGEAAVVTSGLKLEDIKLAKKYRPEALKLVEDKQVVFAVDVTSRSAGSINKNGATFSETTDSEGFATITMTIDRDGDVEKKLTDEIGMGLLKLNQVEEAFGDQLDSIHADQAKIKELISIQ